MFGRAIQGTVVKRDPRQLFYTTVQGRRGPKGTVRGYNGFWGASSDLGAAEDYKKLQGA
jgi:hypothetical protein